MLIDSDVIIEALRGKESADRVLSAASPFMVSVITYMELLQGVRNKEEMKMLRASMAHWQAKVLYLNESICAKAVLLMERHCLGAALSLQDALIAATALEHGLPLVSGNEKHYRMIEGLTLKKYAHK
jgi:predicted nucleic acid-binding protein